MHGGRFDFEDGGSYIGEWYQGRAHGLGLATGPSNQGEYSGEWSTGFETCGVYIWPSGNSYAGSWCKGKRHGFGIQVKGKWIYRGGFTGGFCGRYGVKTSLIDKATFEGTWHLNQFDGYGVELKSNGSFYAGAWKKSKRHGLGVSQTILSSDSGASMDNMKLSGDSTASTVPGLEGTEHSPNSTDLSESTNASMDTFSSPKMSTVRSSASNNNLASSASVSKKALLGRALMKRLKKQHSTGDSKQPNNLYSAFLARKSVATTDFKQQLTQQKTPQQETPIETYAGQWKENMRSGLGVLERSDGSSYTGEWSENARNGLGVTHFADGSTEEGRYRGDKLVLELNRKNRLQMLRHVKVKDCLEEVIYKAKRVAQEAKENAAETAYTRAENARDVALTAETQAYNARHFSDKARYVVRQLAPDFSQPGTFWEERRNLAISRIMKKLSNGSHSAPRSSRRVTARQNLASKTSRSIPPNKSSVSAHSQYYPSTEPNSPHLFNSSDPLEVRSYLQKINQSRYYDWQQTDTVKRRPFSAPVPHGQNRSRRMPELLYSHQQPGYTGGLNALNEELDCSESSELLYIAPDININRLSRSTEESSPMSWDHGAVNAILQNRDHNSPKQAGEKPRLLEQCKSRSQEAPVEEPLITAEHQQPVLRHSSSLQASSQSKGSTESLRKCFSEEKLSKQLILKRLGQMKSEPLDTAATQRDKSPSNMTEVDGQDKQQMQNQFQQQQTQQSRGFTRGGARYRARSYLRGNKQQALTTTRSNVSSNTTSQSSFGHLGRTSDSGYQSSDPASSFSSSILCRDVSFGIGSAHSPSIPEDFDSHQSPVPMPITSSSQQHLDVLYETNLDDTSPGRSPFLDIPHKKSPDEEQQKTPKASHSSNSLIPSNCPTPRPHSNSSTPYQNHYLPRRQLPFYEQYEVEGPTEEELLMRREAFYPTYATDRQIYDIQRTPGYFWPEETPSSVPISRQHPSQKASFYQRSVSEDYYYSESLPGVYEQDTSLYASAPARYSSYDDSLIYPPFLQEMPRGKQRYEDYVYEYAPTLVEPRWMYETERRRSSLPIRKNVAPMTNSELSVSTLAPDNGQRSSMAKVDKIVKEKRVHTTEMSASQQTSFDAPTCTMSDGSRNSSNNSVGTLRLRSNHSNKRNSMATTSDAEEIFRHFFVILAILSRKVWQLCQFLWPLLQRSAEGNPVLLLAAVLTVLTVSLWLGYIRTL